MRLALEGQQVEKPDDIFKDPYVLELQDCRRKLFIQKLNWKNI